MVIFSKPVAEEAEESDWSSDDRYPPEYRKLRERTRPLGYTEMTPQVREHIAHFIRMNWDQHWVDDYQRLIVPPAHEEKQTERKVIAKSLLPCVPSCAAYIMWRLWPWPFSQEPRDLHDPTKDVLAQVDSVTKDLGNRYDRMDTLVKKIHAAYPRLHDVDCPEEVMDTFDRHCVEHFYLSQLDVCAKIYVAMLQLEVRLSADPERTFDIGARPFDVIRAKQRVNMIESLPMALRYLENGKALGELYIQKGDLRRAAWEELLALARFAPWFPTEWAFRPQDVNCTGFGQLFFGIILQLGGLARSLGWADLAVTIYESYAGSRFLTVHQACCINDLVGHAYLQDRENWHDPDYHRHLTVMAKDAFRWRNVSLKLCELGFSNELAYRSDCGNMTPEDYMEITGGFHRMRVAEDGTHVCPYSTNESDESDDFSDTTSLECQSHVLGDGQPTEERVENSQEETPGRHVGMQEITADPHAVTTEEEMLRYDRELDLLRAAAGSTQHAQQSLPVDSSQPQPISPDSLDNGLVGIEHEKPSEAGTSDVPEGLTPKKTRRKKARRSIGRRSNKRAPALQDETWLEEASFEFIPKSVIIERRVRQLEDKHREGRRRRQTKANRRLQLGEVVDSFAAPPGPSESGTESLTREENGTSGTVEENEDQDEKELEAALKVRAPVRDPLAWPEDDFDINGDWADWD